MAPPRSSSVAAMRHRRALTSGTCCVRATDPACRDSGEVLKLLRPNDITRMRIGYATCADFSCCAWLAIRLQGGGARPWSGPEFQVHGNLAGHGVRTRLRGMEAAISTDFTTTPALVPFNVVVVLLVLAGLVLLVTAVRLLRVRMRQRSKENRGIPPLIYAPNRPNVQRPARTRSDAGAPGGAPSTEEASAAASDDQVMFNSTVRPVRIVREPPVPSRSSPPLPSSLSPQARERDLPEEDATLQLLPGRLEPADPGTDKEIRFIRVSGSNRFTLGRDRSSARTHIHLEAATASRMHAFMLFEEGQWRLGNMSQTNPVVINGTALNGDAPWPLADGDRIEFGELTFVFRER